VVALFLFLPALLPVARGGAATDPATLVGHWEGAIEIPGTKLVVDVDFALKDGAVVGDISIPQQQAKDLPLSKVVAAGEELVFSIAEVPGNPTFRGKLEAGGARLAGPFAQGGQSFTFFLERKGDPADGAKESLAGFDAWATKALADFEVPGMGLAVVRAGKVVAAKGYGFRDLEKTKPVTGKTLFAIGSSSKAFTTLTMGTLVDEGKLEWDLPLRKWLPSFALADRSAGDRLTPRDLVTHRSGLPRHDRLWYNTSATRAEMVGRIPFLPANADLREKFQYNNLMFLTAGYLVEQLTGKSWEESVRERVFLPLGMTASNFSVDDMQKADDFAWPHEERKEKLQRIPFRNITNVGPAGAINSNAEDLAKWLLFHLGNGKVGEKQVVRKETLDELHRPVMATGEPVERPEISSPSYALGWFVDSYRGHRRVHHGGAIDGFITMVAFFPDDDLGVAITVNAASALPGIATNTLADKLLGLPAIDWSGEALLKRKAGKEVAKEAKAKKTSVRHPGTKPSHPIDEYAGEYEDAAYGRLTIRVKGGKLEGQFGNTTFPLEHWHYDVWNALPGEDPVFEDMKLNFRCDAKGNVAEIAAPFEPAVADIVFRKSADPRLSDPAYLARYVGKWELASLVLTVSVEGKRLVVDITGQGQTRLKPGLGDEFDLEGANGYSLRFLPDPKGGVGDLEIRQPDGVYTAKRAKKG
jgi:CubicO group peptidase (beta-lactamase class C family)